jgi:hypothetical protein
MDLRTELLAIWTQRGCHARTNANAPRFPQIGRIASRGLVMNVIEWINAVPPTLWGVIIGSLLTVLGVVLTNAANTKRLRLQHEHEWKLESKERDLNLRRDIYLAMMEAMATSIATIGRFGNLNIPSDELELILTDQSPALSKVSIVGQEATIQAVATFSRELTGTFLRLSSKREKLSWLMQRSAVVDQKIAQILQEQEHTQAQLDACSIAEPRDESAANALRKTLALQQQRLEALRTEETELLGQTFPGQMSLVRDSIVESAALERLLVPLISLIRAELELPFEAEGYARIVEEGHQQVIDYLDAYIQDFAPEFGISVNNTPADEMATAG